MSTSSPPHRPLVQCLLRFIGWSIGGLLIIVLVGYAILVIINWHDEPLTAETRAWLTEPDNPVPDAQNAWLAMLALAYQQQSGPQTGRRILKRLHSIPIMNEDPTIYSRFDAQLQQEFGPPPTAISPSPSREICSLRIKGPGILNRIQKNPARIAAQIRANHSLLEKYYEAISLSQFSEEGFSVDILPIQATAGLAKFEASCLARMELSLRLAQNDPKAEQLLQRHLQYWLTTLTQSQSLISMMLANAQVSADLDWVNDLLLQYPQQTAAALQPLLTLYASLAGMSRHDLWLHAMQGEFRFNLATLKVIRKNQQSASTLAHIEDFLLSPLMQPHATLNQYQTCLAQQLQKHQSPASPDSTSNMLYNPIRQPFDGCANFSEYFSRTKVTQIAAGKFVASLQYRP